MKIATVLLFFVFIQTISAQEKRTYQATTAENLDITINGVFDEQEWQNANWENDFIQHEPNEGEEPTRQTEYAILYDAYNLYVAIRSFDDPDSISMRMTRRDETDGDLAGIYIDSYFDKRTSFAFIVSAAGVRSDLVNTNDGDNEDDTWDPIWYAKTSVTKSGWNAEMRIPLTQLRFDENDEQIWGMNVFRLIFREDELSSWQPMKRETAGFTSQFGILRGIENIKPQNSLNVTPYMVARTERFEKEPENPFLKSGKSNGLDAGLDAKIGLTNYLTMDLTINPDFGQVEADPSQVNLSTYETFFREKRPFFIEGNNILSYKLAFGDGVILRITPNHPIFTAKGVKPAGFINGSDYVISAVEHADNIGELYGDCKKPSFEQIFSFFDVVGVVHGVSSDTLGKFLGVVSDRD